ncbi:MAG TPA: YIP1 family protein [Longimicrobiales bacterium]|nr:YIP1 family protein [Longimicrobiales bacterium]
MTTADEAGTEAVTQESAPALPSFPKRVMQVFFSPGDLTSALAKNPAWAAALLLGAILMVGQMALIPADVWDTVFRETMLRQGREMPEGFGAGGTFMRVSAVVGGTIAFLVMSFIIAGVTTLIFAFVMGDEGRFKQYLSILAHAWLIPVVVGFALVPLKISQSNPQFTLNLGTFFFFLPEGYPLKVLTMLDLSQVWAWLVLAQGVHAVDPKRSFGSAAAVLSVLFIGLTMLIAIWAPMPG